MTPDSPTLTIQAPCTVSQPVLTAQEHKNLAALTLFKIENIYNMKPKDWALPSDQQKIIDFEIDDFVTGEDWAEKCAKQMSFAKLPAAEGKEFKIKLKEFAHQFLHEYMQGVCLREAIMNVPEQQISEVNEKYYALRHARENMGNKYINHISNRAYIKLKEMGLSERGILSMHGSIISEVMLIHQMLGPRHCDNIEPAGLNLNEEPAILNNHINQHWERCRAQTNHQKAIKGYS